jgi:hypothetical protein
VEASAENVESRIGTTVAGMTDHYRESVEVIESERPGAALLPALHVQLDRLAAEASGRSGRATLAGAMERLTLTALQVGPQASRPTPARRRALLAIRRVASELRVPTPLPDAGGYVQFLDISPERLRDAVVRVAFAEQQEGLLWLAEQPGSPS